MTIKHYQDIVAQAIARLKKAAGNDPFLSQADWQKFLTTLNKADQPFYNRLIELSFDHEKKDNPTGRVTVRDLDRIGEMLQQQVMALFPVQGGALTLQNAPEIAAMEHTPNQFFKELKVFAETPRNIPDEELLDQIDALGANLTLGLYASGGQSGITSVQINLPNLSITKDNVLEVLSKAPGNPYEHIHEYEIERFEDATIFFEKFPNFQRDPQEAFRAQVLGNIMRNHLNDTKLIILKRDERSYIPLFVLGTHPNLGLVGFSALTIWA